MPGLSTAASSPPVVARTTRADWITALAWAPDGERLAVGAADGSVAGLDVASGGVDERWGHDAPVTAAAWSASGVLATGGQDATVRRAAGAVTVDGWVERLCWRPDGRRLALAVGRHVEVWPAEGEDGRVRSAALPATVTDLAWSPRGTELAAATYGGVHLLRARDAGPGAVVAWTGSVVAVAWSPDGRWLAHGTQDALVGVWDVRRREQLEMTGFQTKVRELAWRHDGARLATGGSSSVTVWDTSGRRGPRGARPTVLDGHDRPVAWLGFRPRGEELASVAADGRCLLWRPGRSDEPLAALQLDEPVTCARWSSDGRRLALGGAGGAVVVLAPAG